MYLDFYRKKQLYFEVVSVCVCMRAQSLQLCLTLGDTMDCSLPGSSVHGILQATILEWVAMPSFRGSSQPRDQTHVSWVSYTVGEFFTTETLGKPILKKTEQQKYKNSGEFLNKVLKSSLTEEESGWNQPWDFIVRHMDLMSNSIRNESHSRGVNGQVYILGSSVKD